jgi:hypothetical protein
MPEHIHTFGVPRTDIENGFNIPKLAEHLEEYAALAEDTRKKMTPVMRAIMALTDSAALRAAEVQGKPNK